jgi:hypothetical protein
MHSNFAKGALALGAVLAAIVSSNAAHAREPVSITLATLISVAASDPSSVAPVEQDGTIPYQVGESCYGWYLEFAPVEGPVVLEELLSIAAPAEHWNIEGETKVAADRSSARTTVTADGRDGHALHVWCVVEDDPEGPYSFRIHEQGASSGTELRFRLERR